MPDGRNTAQENRHSGSQSLIGIGKNVDRKNNPRGESLLLLGWQPLYCWLLLWRCCFWAAGGGAQRCQQQESECCAVNSLGVSPVCSKYCGVYQVLLVYCIKRRDFGDTVQEKSIIRTALLA